MVRDIEDRQHEMPEITEPNGRVTPIRRTASQSFVFEPEENE
jgi:hypothetical protein